MKILIFAGGSGRRLWPISRKVSPKQFEPIIGSRSTLQLAVDRVLEDYGAENIYISTNEVYLPLIAEQLPMLPAQNLIGEPMRRDLAAAVGLAMVHLLAAAEPDEPIAILWGDNYMDDVATFRKLLAAARRLVLEDQAEIVFMGETPRFANENIGWISTTDVSGEVAGQPFYGFESLRYRPDIDECRTMYESGKCVWNTGYFVTSVGYVAQKYRTHQPQMWAKLEQIGQTIGSDDYHATLHDVYPQLAELSFDDAVLTRIEPQDARVLHAEMGWSDPGTLYALKEAIGGSRSDNVTHGLVITDETRDSLVYNYESDKLLATIGLDGMIVINTDNAILVVHKDQIPRVKALVNSMIGTELEKYT